MTLAEAGVRLIDCVHKTPAPRETGYPYVAIPQMKNGRIDFSEARRISDADFIEWTKKARPQLHDVVLSRRTNPGVTATFGANTDFALGQNLVLLRANGEKVLPEFLRWLAVSPSWWSQIEKYINVGAVFDSLKCADVPRFELPIPPKPVQKEIAALLASLDDKIELNRQMNETLEAMAQAIFRDWFVDFGPVRRKLAGTTDPVEIMGGVTVDPVRAAELAELLPDALGDDELPEGWAFASLSDIVANVVERCEPSPVTEARPYVPIDTITARSLILHGTRPGAEAQSSLVTFRENDILFGAMRPYFHKVALAAFEGTTRTTVFVLRPRLAPDLAFALMIVNAEATIEYATSHSSGTTIPYAVWRNGIDGMPVVAPPSVLRAKFGELVGPMLDRMKASSAQNQALAETRDYLLPRLMSGEVRVGDIAQEVAT